MENIQEEVIKRFSNNLLFLEKYDKELYERVVMLSGFIDSGEYTPRYHLEYISKDEEFDIYDSVSNNYLYGENPNKFIKESVENTNFDKMNSIDLLQDNFYNSKGTYDIDSMPDLGQKDAAMVINDIFEYTETFNSPTNDTNKRFRDIEKFVFVGSLLGTHIEPIHGKIRSTLYFICEYNLEIFRLSLFVTSYYKLAQQSDIIFSIMDDDENFDIKFGKYYDYAVKSNYMIKYYCTNYNVHNYFDRMLSVSAQKSPLAFSYRMLIEGLMRPTFKNCLKYPVVDTLSSHSLFKSRPLLILAAGPSLGKNLEWIKINRDRFTILAIGATLEKLLANEISPDIIISIDADDVILNYQFPKDIHEKIFNIPFIASTSTYDKILDIFNNDRIFLIESMGAFKRISQTLNGSSVGEIALNIGSILGSKEIYLLGTDLALDQDTGESHISEHNMGLKIDLDDKKRYNTSLINGDFDLTNSTIVVKGNFRESVVSTFRLTRSIAPYNKTIKVIYSKYPDTKIYNLSDGVYLEGAEPKRIADIEFKDGESLSCDQIVSYLYDHSEKGFSKKEKEIFLGAIALINKIIEEVKVLSTLKIKNYNLFLDNRGTIMQMVTKMPIEYRYLYLDKFYLNYILTMESYLGYQFNAKVPSEANLIKKVKKIWCRQMIDISNEYKTLLKEVVEQEEGI